MDSDSCWESLFHSFNKMVVEVFTGYPKRDRPGASAALSGEGVVYDSGVVVLGLKLLV